MVGWIPDLGLTFLIFDYFLALIRGVLFRVLGTKDCFPRLIRYLLLTLMNYLKDSFGRIEKVKS